jgi:hypothetical protein
MNRSIWKRELGRRRLVERRADIGRGDIERRFGRFLSRIGEDLLQYIRTSKESAGRCRR